MGIPNMVITDLGKALLAKSPTGTALPVTRWQIGKGTLEEGQPLQERTQLLEPVKYIPLAEVKNQGNQCTVTGQFLNTGMEEFRWEELGLLATDPDLGEILYAYGNARGNGDLIEAGEEKYREAIFGIELVFDGEANVTAVIDQSLVFIPMSQKGQPGGVATLDDTGRLPEEQLPEISFDPAGSAAAVQRNLNAHIGNRNNPHGVTAAQAGADPAGSASAVQANLTAHTNNKSNPHGVTAAQAGADPVGSAASVQATLMPLITAVQNTANRKARIVYGKYSGTGTKEAKITFDARPSIVFIGGMQASTQKATGVTIAIDGMKSLAVSDKFSYVNSASAGAASFSGGYASFGSNYVSISVGDYGSGINQSGAVYFYCAIFTE